MSDWTAIADQNAILTQAVEQLKNISLSLENLSGARYEWSGEHGCALCLYWDQHADQLDRGQCRKNAPVPGCGWPETHRNDWCGEFRGMNG